MTPNRPGRLLPLLIAALSAASVVSAAPDPQGSGGPILQIGKAEYRLDQNVFELTFTVTNPGDTAIYLDCQGQPAASRQGKVLLLSFASDEAAADSARPQRIGARQGYQGHRRIYGLGPNTTGAAAHAADPAGATTVKVEMAAYPERTEGEGRPWVSESSLMVSAKPALLARKGKRPAPPKPQRIIKPTE